MVNLAHLKKILHSKWIKTIANSYMLDRKKKQFRIYILNRLPEKRLLIKALIISGNNQCLREK